MSKFNRKTLTKEEISLAISQGTSMSAAAAILMVDRRTFKKEAERHGLYDAGGGHRRVLIPVEEVLSGKHPGMRSSLVSKKIVEGGYKEYKCEKCGISDWQGEKISLELNHIDGNNSNHVLINLELLCPNCHSQTPTFRSKKLKFIKSKK